MWRPSSATVDKAGRPGAVAAIVGACLLACGCGTPKYFRSASISDDGGAGSGQPTGGSGLSSGIGGVSGSAGNSGVLPGTGGIGVGGGAGGSIPGTGGVTCTGIGGTGVAGLGGVGGNASSDTSRYGFESTVQSWRAGDGSPAFLSINRSSAQSYAGQSSLAGSLNATAPGMYALAVDPVVPMVPSGATITFHIYLPADAAITWVQPYVQDANFAFTGLFADVKCLAVGGWSTVTLTAPAGGTAVRRLGVQFYVTPAWTGTVYVDSVNW